MSVDLDNLWGNDLFLTPSGNLASVDGTIKGEQRVLRRLLTNPGDYLWHPDYGAGLPRYIGANLRFDELEGIIRQQLRLEAVVAQSPVPAVRMREIVNGVFVEIIWVDAGTNTRSSVAFDLTP